MGSCAGRIFVVWLPTEPDMAIQGVEDCMRLHDSGTDSYDTRGYGTGRLARHDAIVAEWAVGSQRGVVDVNQDVPRVGSSRGRFRTVAMI
jgi:hypothetical protein